MNLFREEALEAGYILNILYNLDKLTEMKEEQASAESEAIEDCFMNSFWEEVNKFHVEEPKEVTTPDANGEVTERSASGESSSIDDECNQSMKSNALRTSDGTESLLFNEMMSGMDALLSMAFEEYATNTKVENSCVSEDEEDAIFEINENPKNCHNLYKK